MRQIAIPACLYLIQNNLVYISISNLEAASFQVLYQLKILTTALFSVSMLGKKINQYQWCAIIVLMIGVAIVQTDGDGKKKDSENGNPFLGLICVLLACTCSGFAGVFFERILKHRSNKISLWERNIQMAAISCFLGILGLLWKDFTFITTYGFLYGYRPIVWSAIIVNALGGLLTAVVVKYAGMQSVSSYHIYFIYFRQYFESFCNVHCDSIILFYFLFSLWENSQSFFSIRRILCQHCCLHLWRLPRVVTSHCIQGGD